MCAYDMGKNKHLELRIDNNTHKKIKSLAEFNDRSINSKVIQLVRQAVVQHEQKHGPLK